MLCLSCVLRVCKLFGETIHNVFERSCNLLLNVMEVFTVGRGTLLGRPCMVSKNARAVSGIPVCRKLSRCY